MFIKFYNLKFRITQEIKLIFQRFGTPDLLKKNSSWEDANPNEFTNSITRARLPKEQFTELETQNFRLAGLKLWSY